MHCEFVRVNQKRVKCSKCGLVVAFAGNEAKLANECKSTAHICTNRGEKVGGVRVECKGCNGGTTFRTLPVYGCSIWGSCTEKPVDSHRSCKGCGDFHSAG